MTKVLELNSNGIWVYLSNDGKLPTAEASTKPRVRLTKESKVAFFFENLKNDIEEFGCKPLRVSKLLDYFSIKKRGLANLKVITDRLSSEKLYTLPKYSNELKSGSILRIYNYPVIQWGDLFPREKDLEDYVEKHELYKELKISNVLRQHRPKGTKDKLDFQGDCEDQKVVLELKNGSGGKSAVEQVLRYAGILRKQFPDTIIRMILVTGIQNRETELAISGMLPKQRDLFEWYLYKYHKDFDHFEFKELKWAFWIHKNIVNQLVPYTVSDKPGLI